MLNAPVHTISSISFAMFYFDYFYEKFPEELSNEKLPDNLNLILDILELPEYSDLQLESLNFFIKINHKKLFRRLLQELTQKIELKKSFMN